MAPQRPRRVAPAPGLPVAVLAVLLAVLPAARGCTRVLFTAGTGTPETANGTATVITGRTMDWAVDTRSDMWAFPRGLARDGAAGSNPIKWTSKHGSLIVSFYEAGTVDGINEEGLVANVLYLAESNYGTPGGKPTLSIAAWAQYVLDNFATVKAAVTALRAEPFRIVAPIMPDGREAQGHLSLADASGDSAVFEYIDGKLVIHHGREYRVMTNSPSYDQQISIERYWKGVGGKAFLPGTVRAADRFARASYFLGIAPRALVPAIASAVPNGSFAFQALATVRSLAQAMSVPLGAAGGPSEPNIAPTMWRTVLDSSNRVMLYDSTLSPNTFWVRVRGLNLKPGAPVLKLPLQGGRTYAGDATSKFEPAAPFKFLS